MDAATWAFMESAGYGAKRMRAERLAMPLVSAECQFLAPAEHGDRCEVRSRIARFGGKRSEEHTSELQSRLHLVCRLLLEKKKKKNTYISKMKISYSNS